MAKKRIYVPVTDEMLGILKQVATNSNRSVANIASILLVGGLKDAERNAEYGNKVTVNFEGVIIQPVKT